MNVSTIDVLWVLLSAALVFLMQAGFLCLESGMTRNKNNINVAIKNLTDLGISIILFWTFGFALMFGDTWHGWIGLTEFGLDFSQAGVWPVAFFLFQVMFCGTAVTIISGAVAERMRFDGYIILAALVSGLIYPIFGHWAWNGLDIGSSNGWLGQLGFVDFAGSTVVHSVGGWASLATLLIIGPRMGRFPVDGPPQKIPGSNLPVAVLGVVLLWFGWFGFNGGSTLAMNDQVPHILANTILAAGAGLVGALLVGWFTRQRADVDLSINGSLAGLVAITANAHAVSSLSAVIIGVVGGLVMLWTNALLEKFRIDDAVGAIPVHLGAGIWGTLAVALFGQPHLLGTGLSLGAQLAVQFLGIVVAAGWTFGITYLVLRLINPWQPLRVSPEDEKIGLNVSEHGATTEIFDLFNVMAQQAKTGDLSLRAPVEPFTEVGQIAERYNLLMESLERMTNKAETMERLDRLKDEFLANTSHELRTPLNGIIGITESMMDGIAGPLTPAQRQNMSLVTSSARRLSSLIDDILDFSKLKHHALTLQIKPLYLPPLVDLVLALSEPLVGSKPLQLINDVEVTMAPIYGDENRVQQILHNLVGNAIKFTDSGTVKISAQVMDHLTNGTSSTAKFVAITVSDTGIGIPENKLKRIFQPFEQADGSISRQYGGTGLGLTVTQQLVALHGGTIEVASQPGEGTSFTFTLPLSEEQPETIHVSQMDERKIAASFMISDQTPVAETALAPREGDFHILVVDDEPVNRRVLINQLSLQQYNVTEANDGLEALKLIHNQNGHPFDLVVLDVMMPRMSGFDVCREIRRRHSATELPVIMLTAKHQLASLVTSFDAGANDYLTKPFSKVELLVRIKTHLQLNNLRELNASKDRFFSIVAHDLKGPFQPLLGFSEMLATSARELPSEQIQEISESIYRSSQNVYGLLENLLEWSRLHQGKMAYKPVDIDLRQMVTRTVNLLAEIAVAKQITLQSWVAEGLWVAADEYMLDTIIRNLVTNALKFTPAEGKVMIEAQLTEQPYSELLPFDSVYPSSFIEIAVTDTGVGISPENLDKLFRIDVHHSTFGTAQEKGTGLGLIICQEMIEKHGGQISVESELGHSTTFRFTIPASPKMVDGVVNQNQQPDLIIADFDLEETQLIPLPAKQAALLLDLALAGDMLGLEQQAAYIERLDSKFKPFVRKLRALAKGFEEEAILKLVERFASSQAQLY